MHRKLESSYRIPYLVHLFCVAGGGVTTAEATQLNRPSNSVSTVTSWYSTHRVLVLFGFLPYFTGAS